MPKDEKPKPKKKATDPVKVLMHQLDKSLNTTVDIGELFSSARPEVRQKLINQARQMKHKLDKAESGTDTDGNESDRTAMALVRHINNIILGQV